MEEFKAKKREKFEYNGKENEIEGNFILTEKADERIQKLYNQLKSNIPIMLEGPTGTSKTKTIQVLCKLIGLDLIRINLSSETTIEDLMGRLIADKDNSFSGFTYKKGAFADAYTNGKVLLLDEVNLAPNPVLQCMLNALDFNKVTQNIPGFGLQTFYRHKNFRIVATQNPKKGAFIFTRDRLSNKFLETFQVIEFPKFSAEELKEIALKEAKKLKYLKNGEKNIKKEKIIFQLSEFHNEWVESPLSKESPQCFTVRDLNVSIKAISENKEPNEVINCFYGARYDKKINNEMQEILRNKYNYLYKEQNILPDLPDKFPKCFQSNTLKKAFQIAKMAIDSGKHLLFVGKEEIGLTQIAKWISYYFSDNKDKKDNNFLFVFTPETTVSDILGRYIPAPQTEKNENIMIWEDGPLTKAIRDGYSCVFTNLSSAQVKVAERLNSLFDPKECEEDYTFDLSENAEPNININKKFHFVSTCNSDKLKYLSPALLNRLMVIYLSDQLENLQMEDFLNLIQIILENEFKGEFIDPEIIQEIWENQKKYNYSMSKLAKFSKSVYRLYLECKKNIDKKDLVDYIHNLLFGEKIINIIPRSIRNLAEILFNTNKQDSTDEKFYFMDSDNLKNLMINLYSCSICRIPVCLIGPTGLGKTSMARAFSEYIRNEPGKMYSFHLETQVDDMFGTFTFKNGMPEIMEGPLTESLKEGKVFIGDEFNLAEDSILQTLSIAFENNDENNDYNSSCLIPGIGIKITYNKKFFFIACQNDLSTAGRKKLPHIIEKRLRIFDYPLPSLKDLMISCKDIINENKIEEVEDNKNEDSMSKKISRAAKYHVSHEKLANFMYEINNDKNKKHIGIWSMRNIRKILRRNAYQYFNEKKYINVRFELQLVIYILSEIPTTKRKEALSEVINILKKTFSPEPQLIKDITEVINSVPRIEIRNINRENKRFLFKGKSGIEIGNTFDGLENISSLMETVFYAKFANFKEPINFCGPSSYKTFIAKKLLNNADVINLYPETSIEQLLGSIYLVNNFDAKNYYLENILKIIGKVDELHYYKDIINHLEGNKNDNDNLYKKEKELTQLIGSSEKELPDCIFNALKSLKEKLFESNNNNYGIFKDFTSIFKTGILLEKILKQSPIILKNLSNLSPAVLERFNDLFNYNPKLTLNEDFCGTFTSKMDKKEISNFSDQFRVISISSLSSIRNLSDATRSRFTTIYTSEYDNKEKEIASKTFVKPMSIPQEFFKFILKYETTFNTKLSFSDITKILFIYKKFNEKYNNENNMNLLYIIFSIYFALYSNFDKKNRKDKFLKILIDLNNNKNFDINELDNLSLKNNINNLENPFLFEENIVKSKFTKIEIISNILKDNGDNLCFTAPFNKLLNYIHFSLALNIPLIIEGPIGIGKKTAIGYISKILKLKEICFPISNKTTVEDLFCKTIPIQTDNGLEFKISRSKLLDVIDSDNKDKSLENCIIILDNLEQASSNVLESLIPVFDGSNNNIFLPNGDTVKKSKYKLIAIFDNTSKGTNIRNSIPNAIKNSSILFKCENFLEEKYIEKIANKMIMNNYLERFVQDYMTIFNFCKENQKKEIFSLNDFAKFQTISKITLKDNIIDYETLIQILLIYRFNNPDDLKFITSKLGYSLNQDLWPIIEYFYSLEEKENIIKLFPVEKNNNKFFNYKIKNFNESKMNDVKKKLFTLTPEQRFGLIFLMISIQSNIPCILQGPTASGKSYLIKLFCEILGQEPELIVLNNDSGINILIGQIAPQSGLEDKDINEIINAINECEDIREVYSIFEENDFINNPKDWKPKDFKEKLAKIASIKSKLSYGEKKRINKIEKMLNDELSFLKHLKNEDSPFINALKSGKWIILDGIESAEPELYERLSSLCDLKDKSINLFEKGPQYEYSIKEGIPKDFKIHKDFRLFITYNPFEAEQSKKLSNGFISKCLTYTLPQIDKDCKSSALVLNGLFNYNKTFGENNKKEEIKTDLPSDGINKIKQLKHKKDRQKTKIRRSKFDVDENSDSDKDNEEEDEDELIEELEEDEEKNRKDKKESFKNEIKDEEIMKEKEIENKIYFKKEKEGIILGKKNIRELAIKLANIHIFSKEFAKDKIHSFAGQKNFSGRSLKYIYNSINIRNYDLTEAIISVFEDCYCFSYSDPEKMKNCLINEFCKKPMNYNEIMNYLRRDEEDMTEKYEPLYLIIDDYIKDQSPFKYNTFLDFLDCLILNDVQEFKSKIEDTLLLLDNKNIKNNYYIFFRIIYNILSELIIKGEEERTKVNICLKLKITSPEISSKLNSVMVGQKRYLLFRKLIEKNLVNFDIIYVDYNEYLLKIQNDNKINSFFELFQKNKNIVVDSITLGLLYPDIENDKYINLNKGKREIVNAILKLINNCILNLEKPEEHIEMKIFDILLKLINSKLFFDSIENIYSDEKLPEIEDDKIEQNSKEIIKILEELINIEIFVIDSVFHDLQLIFRDWNQKYHKFHRFIISAISKKNGNEEIIKIGNDFQKLIEKLEKLDISDENNNIERAIKYLRKIRQNEISLKNAEEYVNLIEKEYKDKKSKEKNTKSFIRFEFRPEDNVDNYEETLIIRYGKDNNNFEKGNTKFNKIIFSLINYNKCLKIIENIENTKNKIERLGYYNELDLVINKQGENKGLKGALKILRKIIFEDNKEIKIQYSKDILLSNLTIELFIINNFKSYLNIYKIYEKINKYKSRDHIDNENRKFAYYLTNNIPPNFEIIIPELNINAILSLFVLNPYEDNDELKIGLLTEVLGINPFMNEFKSFEKKVFEFQKSDLSNISLIEGLNKFVDICKETLFENQDIKFLISNKTKENKIIIEELYNNRCKIEKNEYLIKLIEIIKSIYDSIDSPKIQLELDDLFFICDKNWKKNTKEVYYNHPYLMYNLFKNPDIELELRDNLLKTDTFRKNDKNKFPIYTHILRILFSENELSFQGNSNTYTSELVEKNLIDKIKTANNEKKIKNLSWIGLLINNAITEKYISSRMTYIYNYLCKLSEIKLSPSCSFKDKYDSIIEKIIDFVSECCFNNKIDDIFKVNIKKEININDEISENIVYLIRLYNIISSEIKNCKKKEYDKLKHECFIIFKEIEPKKNKINTIYDRLINAIKIDIEKEKQYRKSKFIENKPNSYFNSYQDLKKKAEDFKKKYNELLNNKNKINYNIFNTRINELLSIKNSIKKYGDLFSNGELIVKELNIPSCDEINFEGHDEIKIGKNDLKKGIYYFYEKFNGTQVILSEGKIKIKKNLNDILKIKKIEKINDNKLSKKLEEIRKKNKNIIIKDDEIKIKLEISNSQIDINRIQERDGNLLYDLKTIIKDIDDNSKKISIHLKDDCEFEGVKGNRVLMILQELINIRNKFNNISLKNPKFVNEQSTELNETKKVCEDYENIKSIIMDEYDSILKEVNGFKEIIKEYDGDEKIVSKAFLLNFELESVKKNKKIDFSSFKGFQFRSNFISLSSDNKTIKTSYPDYFHFRLGNIIPSLYGTSTYSVNIVSFINKQLKVEIEEDIDEKYKNSFSISNNIIPPSNPIVIKFNIPDKKIEKIEDVKIDLKIKISGVIPDDINTLTINNKFSFHFLPLSVIIFSKKYIFQWENNSLILNERFFKQGNTIRINFKILNFEGNYEMLKNNYTLISLENNTIDMPSISLEEKETYGSFKIKIPQTVEQTKNNFHAEFSLYFTKNLIIPIKINAKIKEYDFGLFYYNAFKGEIQDHTENKLLTIYKYKNDSVRFGMQKIYLYFRIQCNEFIDEEDEIEQHNLIINVPPRHKLLSFDIRKKEESFKNGITIKIPISILNFQSQQNYDSLNNYLSTNNLEIEFICDNISKKFTIKLIIENSFAKEKIRFCSIPYFVYHKNTFRKLEDYNYDEFSKDKVVYLNYENTNYINPKRSKLYEKKIKKDKKKVSFISENCKLIFIINDFRNNYNIDIWGPYKFYNSIKKFFESKIDRFNELNIERAKKEIESIYNKMKKITKFNILNKKYEGITEEDYKNISTMREFISYICSKKVILEDKINLLNNLSKYFDDNKTLIGYIEDLKNKENEKYLPIIYHRIIFKIGNIMKERIEDLEKKYNGSYAGFLKDKLFEKLRKDYKEDEFVEKVKNVFCKKNEDIIKSKIYQFDEYSNEPKILEKIPKNKAINEKLKDDKIDSQLEISTAILNNYEDMPKDLNTINKIIELIKKSYIITQEFPFLIQKITNNESNILFNFLYSIYVSYIDYNKNIISEDLYKFCFLFENLCKKLKSEVNLDDYEEIKNLSKDINIEAINLNEFPKLKDINIKKKNKWNRTIKTKSKIEYFNLGNIEKEEKYEFVMQQKTEKEKKNINISHRQSFRQSFKLPNSSKEEKNNDIKEDEKKDSDDEDSENNEIYEKESEIIKEVSKERLEHFKSDKNLTKYIVNLMLNKFKIQKSESVRIPELLEENDELDNKLEKKSKLQENLKDPSLSILKLSKIISFKLFRAAVNQNTQTKKICVVIAIDCCRTIDIIKKFFHAILVYGIINCLNALEIPYSIVLFADYQFIYTIKKFDTPHTEEIYKLVLDCIMIPRYSTRILDACFYINKKIIHPKRSNRRIFIISNGLDPKLIYGDQWPELLNNEKDKYCFFFIKSDIDEEDKISKIWDNFEKDSGYDVVKIDNENDILIGQEYIYTKFAHVLSEKIILTEEELKKAQKNINNIENNKFYQPKYEEIYNLYKDDLDTILESLKYSYENEDKKFYIFNEKHKLSHINIKSTEKDINLIHPFKIKSIKGEKSNNKLTKFEIKDINLELFDNIFPPNKPSMYAPSLKGTRLYLVGLVKYMITGGQENKIWLEKKACLKRNYRISVIIDSSKSCFNNINYGHTYKTIFTFLKILSLIEIPFFDLIIATDKEPIILCSGNDTMNSLNNNSILWEGLASVLIRNNHNICNLKDCILDVLKLKSLNLAKKSFLFILTDGLFDNEDTKCLSDLISFLEENLISVYGVGLGLYPERIKNIFSKCFWSANPNLLLNALSLFYSDESIPNENLESVIPKIDDEDKKSLINDINEISKNYNNYITYGNLFDYLNNRPFNLESMEEIANKDEAENITDNKQIKEDNTMCRPNTFKGLKVLLCCFWSKDYSDRDSDWIDPKYLTQSYSSGKCLNDAFKYYGIELIVKTKYDECIKELMKGGKYYAAWIICGDGIERKQINSNLVGQFIEVLIKFWKNGGALLFWCDNYPLVYEANLFLKIVEFQGEECNIRFVGNYKGEKEMSDGDIRTKKCGIFNNERRFINGKVMRFSLGHNLKKIYEGSSVSYAKIKKDDDIELNEEMNDIKEDQLDNPTDENLLPFIPFAYDNKGNLSIIFYPSTNQEGDIIIDGGFSKLFNEIETNGTYRYLLNCIAWTTQFSKRMMDKGYSWVESFNLNSFSYDINPDAKWIFRKEISIKEFDIIYLIDATGSMKNEINAAREQVVNILNELNNNYPEFDFNFGAIFYRDKIDSPSDENAFFNLTDNMENLKNNISSIKAYGGGDIPEDWVWGYKTAVEDIAWRKGTRLIIHIADAGAHGKEFSKNDKYPDEGPKLEKYIEKCVEKNIKIIGLKIRIGKKVRSEQSFNKIKDIYDKYKIKINGKNQLIDIYPFERGNEKEISNQFKNLVLKAATAAVPKNN